MVSIKEQEPNDEEKPESPLRFPTPPPLPSHLTFSKPDPPKSHTHENLSQIIAMDRRIHGFSPLRSPNKPIQQQHPIPPQSAPPEPIQVNPLSPVLSPVIVVNRSIREELTAMSKMDPGENGFSGSDRGPSGNDRGGEGRTARSVSSISYRERREATVKSAALGFRICEVVFCLISFSVMASDKTQGWAGDSFYRYKEYRYCLSVSVIGFVYAGFQAFDLVYCLITGIHVIHNAIRYSFDFSMDQILTYLLISASSAAASRVDDWQSNWGKDDFTVMASASVGMSFVAFIAFAFSSLISGYNLCTRSHS